MAFKNKKNQAPSVEKAWRANNNWQDHTGCCGVMRPAGWGCVPGKKKTDG